MKKKETRSVESYFQTQNEHWNTYAFDCLVEAREKGIFPNQEVPLNLFGLGVELLVENWQSPVKAVELVKAKIEKHKLDKEQQLFVLGWIAKYLLSTEYDEADTTHINELLDIEVKKLEQAEKANEPPKPIVQDIRETLKALVQLELDQLPETLKELQPDKRLSILCKLIPYVLPRVKSVHSEKGEGEENPFGFNW